MKTMEEIKTDLSIWWYGVKWNAKRKFDSAVKWCEDNKELAIAMIPVGIVAIKSVGNSVHSFERKRNLEKEQELKEMYVYDHSLGMYHKLRRPLTASEKVLISSKVKNGEQKVDVLARMGLLG